MAWGVCSVAEVSMAPGRRGFSRLNALCRHPSIDRRVSPPVLHSFHCRRRRRRRRCRPVPLPHPAARRGATAMAGPGSHSNGPAGSEAPEAAPAPKRIKVNSGSWQHFVGPSYAVTGLLLTDHRMTVPLDHSGVCSVHV